MHIQPDPQTFTVKLTRAEIRLIAYGLGLHAANEGTQDVKIEQCKTLQEAFMNALKQNYPKDKK